MLFSEIQGNDYIKRKLINMIEDKRISHALLFNGPEGSAKLQLALAFATYLNCENRSNGDACGKCYSCRQISKLSHPDLHFIFPIGNSKLKKLKEPMSADFMEEWREFVAETHAFGTLYDWTNAIRIDSGQAIINTNDCNGIIKTLSYTAYESKYKIMIIWMAENLFHAAAPKILKILEEPPDNTLFILITENKDAILDTIISRLQTVNIPEFTNEDIKNILVNNYDVDINEAYKISESCDGNAALAINSALSSGDPLMSFDLFIRWMRICLKPNMMEIIPFAEELAKNGRESNIMFLKNALAYLRQALFYNETGAFLVPINDEYELTFTKFSKFVRHDNIAIFDNNIENAINNVKRNGNLPLIMLNLTVSLCRAFKQ
ncbi:hypothetical protein LJC69_01220 [Bacteroidales bacterium OttesenSCG-928-K22]|nr:hypothetical protein [Bacteroidales bacterium OttesenSCG-928-L14]MDL2240223.1 hypothetical protein [Bacteroidales bacterium OttesenSCG-928-K22]